MLAVAWRELDRFHALVAINARLSRDEVHRLRLPVLVHLAPLIERGRRDGAFRADVPPDPRREVRPPARGPDG